MPIYEFENEDGDRIERFIKSWRECPPFILTDNGQIWALAVSVPTMRPDDMWMGYYDHGLGVHVTSRAAHRDAMKAVGAEQSPGTDDCSRKQAEEHAAGVHRERRKKADAERMDTVGNTVREIMI